MINENINKNARRWLNYLMLHKMDSIENSINHTYVVEEFESEENVTERFDHMSIEVIPRDTVSAIFKYSDEDCAILNFANFIEPGGGFLRGATAQEECLCYESTLYPVLLSQKEEYYSKNSHLNPITFSNRALYSKDIEFIRGDQIVKCDVLTSAAPCLCGTNIDPDDPCIIHALYDRIDFILNTMYDMDASTLILGAFGCGAFRNNPLMVATIFKYFLENKYSKCFQKVIFAIPDGKDCNYQVFNAIINNTISKQVIKSLLADLKF